MHRNRVMMRVRIDLIDDAQQPARVRAGLFVSERRLDRPERLTSPRRQLFAAGVSR
jgi:hypothetical protein